MGNLPKCEATGKVRFETKSDAQVKIHKMRDIYSRKTGQRCNRLRKKRKEKRAYYCKFCGGWHLTSQDFSTVKQIKAANNLELSE